MHADFSVELGREDAAMELPWRSPQDGSVRFYDLKQNPELLLNIEEAFNNSALGEFLASVNSAVCLLQSCKCDHWSSREISEEEQIYGEPVKFGSYVDLVFPAGPERYALPAHEALAAALCKLLKRAPDVSCSAEFILRRCYFHEADTEDSTPGFGMTYYLFGYGADEAEARKHWVIGMKLVENALLQLSAEQRRAQAQT